MVKGIIPSSYLLPAFGTQNRVMGPPKSTFGISVRKGSQTNSTDRFVTMRKEAQKKEEGRKKMEEDDRTQQGHGGVLPGHGWLACIGVSYG